MSLNFLCFAHETFILCNSKNSTYFLRGPWLRMQCLICPILVNECDMSGIDIELQHRRITINKSIIIKILLINALKLELFPSLKCKSCISYNFLSEQLLFDFITKFQTRISIKNPLKSTRVQTKKLL